MILIRKSISDSESIKAITKLLDMYICKITQFSYVEILKLNSLIPNPPVLQIPYHILMIRHHSILAVGKVYLYIMFLFALSSIAV